MKKIILAAILLLMLPYHSFAKVTFDGTTGNYLAAPYSTDFSTTGGFSGAFIFTAPDHTGITVREHILGTRKDNLGFQVSVKENVAGTGSIQFYLLGGTGATWTEDTVCDGNPHLIVYTVVDNGAAGTANLWVDGVKQTVQNTLYDDGDINDTSNGAFRIGQDNNDQWTFNGTITEVYHWKGVALSQDEIDILNSKVGGKWIKGIGRTIQRDKLVAYWPLDRHNKTSGGVNNYPRSIATITSVDMGDNNDLTGTGTGAAVMAVDTGEFTIPKTTYYVSAAGSSNNTGTTTSDTWTIGRINAVSSYFGPRPGDTILFKRGDLMRSTTMLDLPNGSGLDDSILTTDTSNYIKYDAYGEGPLPIISSSIFKGSASDWTNEAGTNYWYTASTREVGNIIFGDYALFGRRRVDKLGTRGLAQQGDFWWDDNSAHDDPVGGTVEDPNETDQRVYVYSIGNPAEFLGYGGKIELCVAPTSATEGKGNYVTLQNMDIRHSASLGLELSGNSHVIVRNCAFRYIGGAYASAYPSISRYGNAVQLWGGGTLKEILVEKNYFDTIWDAAVTPQFTIINDSDSDLINNVYIRNNIIKNARYAFEVFNNDADATTSNVFFDNNTILDSGYGSYNTLGNMVKTIYIGQTNGTINNIFIRNNIFDRVNDRNGYGALIKFERTNELAGITFSNNLYNSYGNNLCSIAGAAKTFAQWQAAPYNKDANTINGKGSALDSDYRPIKGSPVINAGADLSALIAADYYGYTRPSGSAFDIGATEFIQGIDPFERSQINGNWPFNKGRFFNRKYETEEFGE